MAFEKLDYDIKYEIYISLCLLGADSNILSVIGSWNETMPNDVLLEMMRTYNEEIRDNLKMKLETTKYE
ncbi:hypothetical protein [Polaribacter sp.]|uniref:hypothetical protein n=1 Tax=Polaribacter sp. TaxID=1920175 RepID=UPI004048461E